MKGYANKKAGEFCSIHAVLEALLIRNNYTENNNEIMNRRHKAVRIW